MPIEHCSIHVSEIELYPAIRMNWEHVIHKEDLQPAFKAVVDLLDASESSLYILVDLSKAPDFPMVETTLEALRGPFRHPCVAEWLVIDAKRPARMIGDLLMRSSGRKNIRWFKREEQALNYMAKAVKV